MSENESSECVPPSKKSEGAGEDVGGKGRDYTVSVALPSSILENAQSPELRTYLAGQVRIIFVAIVALYYLARRILVDRTCQTLGTVLIM